jgi:hypothetical protein
MVQHALGDLLRDVERGKAAADRVADVVKDPVVDAGEPVEVLLQALGARVGLLPGDGEDILADLRLSVDERGGGGRERKRMTRFRLLRAAGSVQTPAFSSISRQDMQRTSSRRWPVSINILMNGPLGFPRASAARQTARSSSSPRLKSDRDLLRSVEPARDPIAADMPGLPACRAWPAPATRAGLRADGAATALDHCIHGESCSGSRSGQ